MKKLIFYLIVGMALSAIGCVNPKANNEVLPETSESYSDFSDRNTVGETSTPMTEQTEIDNFIEEKETIPESTTVSAEETVPETQSMSETTSDSTQEMESNPVETTEQKSNQSTFEGSAIEGEIGL